MSIESFARQLADASTAQPATSDLSPEDFGARGLGRLGELGEELFDQWQAAVTAAATQAAEASESLTSTCADLWTVADSYAEADRTVSSSFDLSHVGE